MRILIVQGRKIRVGEGIYTSHGMRERERLHFNRYDIFVYTTNGLVGEVKTESKDTHTVNISLHTYSPSPNP